MAKAKRAKRPTCSKHGRAWRKGSSGGSTKAAVSAGASGLARCRHHPEDFATKANGAKAKLPDVFRALRLSDWAKAWSVGRSLAPGERADIAVRFGGAFGDQFGTAVVSRDGYGFGQDGRMVLALESGGMVRYLPESQWPKAPLATLKNTRQQKRSTTSSGAKRRARFDASDRSDATYAAMYAPADRPHDDPLWEGRVAPTVNIRNYTGHPIRMAHLRERPLLPNGGTSGRYVWLSDTVSGFDAGMTKYRVDTPAQIKKAQSALRREGVSRSSVFVEGAASTFNPVAVLYADGPARLARP